MDGHSSRLFFPLCLLTATLCAGEGVDWTKIGLTSPCGAGPDAKVVQTLRLAGKGEVKQNVIVDHNWGKGDAVEIRGDGAILRYCEIRNGLNDAVEVYAKNVTIESCRIHHFLASTFKKQQDAHGITGRPNGLTIRNCEIYYVTGDCVQFDPDREEWDDVTIEHCEMWTGPLPEDAAGFKKGEKPGENAFDTKTTPKGKRPRVVIRDCIFNGWGNGQIAVGAALNIKENVDATVENCVFYGNAFCNRVRGKNKPGFGAHVTFRNCLFYDSEVAIRFEDKIENLEILNCGWGSGLRAQLANVGGHGKGFLMQGSRSVGAMPRLPDGKPAFGWRLTQYLGGGKAAPEAIASLDKTLSEKPPEKEPEPEVLVLSFPEIDKALLENRFENALDIIGSKKKGADKLTLEMLDAAEERAKRGKAVTDAIASSGERVKGVRLIVGVAGMRSRAVARRASDNGIEVDAAGVVTTVRFGDLRPSEIVRLARSAMEETPQNRLLLARFLADCGSTEEAVNELGKLRSDPAVGEEASRLLSEL